MTGQGVSSSIANRQALLGYTELQIDMSNPLSLPKLKSLRIKRFKRMKDAPIDLEELNVLVGANNSGKSSVIQGVHFAIALLQAVGLEGKFSSASNKLSASLSPEQLIYSPSDDVYALASGGRLVESEGSAMEFSFTLDDGDSCSITVRKGRNRNIMVAVENARVAERLSSLEKPFSIFSPGLAGITKSEAYVSDGVLMRALARGDANLVLRNILLRLWNTPEWSTFLDDLHEVFPGVELRVTFRERTDEFIIAEVKLEGRWVPLELSGTGVLQATQILSYIHKFSPSLVVLDEPDSHLHPNNQRLLCSLLRRVSEDRNTHVLLTTHSRHVVDAVGHGAGLLWVRAGTVDRAQPDDEIGVLLDIGALDVKERAGDATTKAVVLSEDKGLRPLEALLASSGFELEATATLSYLGVTGIKQLKPLVAMIRATNPGVKILLHRDRDYLLKPEAEEWEKSVRAIDVEPFLTDGVDVETHFLTREHLVAVNKDRSEAEIDQLLNETEAAVADGMIENYVNGRIQVEREAGNGAKVNAGKLATEGRKAVAGDQKRYRHGKKFLKEIRRRHQERFNENLVVFSPNTTLRHDVLSGVAKKAFGTNPS